MRFPPPTHHLLKHDPDSGWTVVQPSPGHFVWTSPTGTRHHIVPEGYTEPPDPLPPEDGPTSIPALVFAPPPRESLAWVARPNKHGLVTDAAHATAARLTRAAAPDAPDASPTPDDEPDF